MRDDDEGFSELETAFFEEGDQLEWQEPVTFDDLADEAVGDQPSRWARWFGRSSDAPSFA